jgi:hypothetical protein
MHFKEESFVKVTYSIYLSRKETCLDAYALCHLESKLCIYIVLRQICLIGSMRSCEDSELCTIHNTRAYRQGTGGTSGSTGKDPKRVELQ